MKATNPILKWDVVMLERKSKKENAPIWRAAAQMLSRSSASRVEVNLNRLEKFAGEKAHVFVPGKVLGEGKLGKKLIVGAFSYSASARSKIAMAGGEALGVEEFVKRHPKGSGVLLVE